MSKNIIVLSIVLGMLFQCKSKQGIEKVNVVKELANENPAAEEFNEYGSDSKAIEIADRVMKAMGGRKSWDDARYFKWNFFGSRTLWWDKQKGDVRIQMHNADSTIILVNIFNNLGKVYSSGQEITNTDTLSNFLKKGKGIWINDGYWLFMPFKLKDSGVSLSFVGEDTTDAGIASDVLRLTFENVGNTPKNIYHVWVDKKDNLIKQWAFYRDSNLAEPNFVTSWEGYEKYNSILLASIRGERKITNIDVPLSIPESVFKNF